MIYVKLRFKRPSGSSDEWHVTLEVDLTSVASGRQPYDVAGYLEARVVALARPGDITVG